MMAYNVELYIEKAVRSVLNQTVPEVEIYFRNNGSTDRTVDIPLYGLLLQKAS